MAQYDPANIRGIDLYPVEPSLVLVLALLVVTCFQWGTYCCARVGGQHRRHVRDGESSAPRVSSVSRLSLAVVNSFRVLAFRTTVGFRPWVFCLAEVFVTVAYVAVLVVWTCVVESSPNGEPLNWCSRAGVLAASQFPWITLLGTKRNVVSLVTRISAQKLNFVHRVAARACLVLIGIHALGGANSFSFLERASGEAELFGVVAASAFTVLAIVSIRPVREAAYELFFYLHFVAVIVIMVATILHVKNYSGSSFTFYVWPSFVFWGADRFIRTGWMLYFSLARPCSDQKPGALDASAELLSEDLVRVTFRPPDGFCWSPGQFVYLVVPSVSRLPFEAHPFSIATVDSTLFAPDAKVEEGARLKELVFLIRVKSGFTRRLKDAAVRADRVKVYVDGPYGEAVGLDRYDTSLLVAGTGITFILPLLLNIVESVRSGRSCCHRVVLIWVIRETGLLNCVSEPLAKAIRLAPPQLKVDIQVFVTNRHPRLSPVAPKHRIHSEKVHSGPFENQNPPTDSADLLDALDGAVLFAPWLKVASGRPNLEHMLGEEISAARGCKVSVSVCGPNTVVEVVRKTLRLPWGDPSSPLNGGPSVTLHVACFGHA